jgi:NAD(P)H dehydrogenase (quinone)
LLDATVYFTQAAKEEKVDLVVNMSQRTARREANSHAAQNHWIAERLFDYSGVPVTHLRPGLFDEWLLYFAKQIKEQNRLVSPFGEASYASLAGEDIARVIASIIIKPEGHTGKTYDLYGPQSITQHEVAELLSGLLNRKITYEPISIPAFAELLRPFSTPYFIQHISAISQDFRDGILKGDNNLVEEITGRKPISVREFIQANIGSFQ